MKRYEQIAEDFAGHIRAGTLRPGDRMPSVRSVSGSRKVSPATVVQAYQLLEDRGEISVRPRSGHYVNARLGGVPEPAVSCPSQEPVAVDVRDLVYELLDAVKRRNLVHLGSAFPGAELFPLARLARALHTAAARIDPQTVYEQLSPGNADLRRQIARRYLERGCNVPMEEIVITTGALEGLNLCLQAVTRPGDLVAIESPTFYAALEAIERAGLKALEIPTHPREGMDLAALAQALKKHRVAACWVMTSFQNPLGSCMPEDRKQALVALLARHDVPLIEDDVYAELHFGEQAPRPAKAWDRAGRVLHCGSFSKCLAPGYRVGWAAAGRHAKAVQRAKLMGSIATSVPTQAAISEFLRHAGYKHHLRKLRRTLATQQAAMLEAIEQSFPPGTRVTRPDGGYFLWLELPAKVRALDLHRRALEQGITVAPGPIFSPRRAFRNCIRLNYGIAWTPRVEAAIAKLGALAAR